LPVKVAGIACLNAPNTQKTKKHTQKTKNTQKTKQNNKKKNTHKQKSTQQQTKLMASRASRGERGLVFH